MRWMWMAAMAVVLAGVAAGQSAVKVAWVDCAAAMSEPHYPQIARMAAVEGEVKARYVVDAEGKAGAVRVEGHAVLRRSVEWALGRSKFPERCRGKELDVVVGFRLGEQPAPAMRTKVDFTPLNRFDVVSGAMGLNAKLDERMWTEGSRGRACGRRWPFQKALRSDLDLVEFRVGRWTRVGKSRDIDYVIYGVWRSSGAQRHMLTMFFGGLTGGVAERAMKSGAESWVVREWDCAVEGIVDLKGSARDGRRWRYIEIPLGGNVYYEGVPGEVAKSFDRVMDSMCCLPCQVCK